MTLAELFDAHAQAVRRYLVRRLGTDADPLSTADDLTAEVFLVAWRRRSDVPAGAELPWLYAVARRVLANYRRRAADIPTNDIESLDAIDDNDPSELVTEDLALRTAWERLSPRDREVLRLSAWEGLSGDALGVALGMSTGGAASALSRARARLSQEIAAALMQDS